MEQLLEQITGEVESVIYQNEENGYTVARVFCDDGQVLTVVFALFYGVISWQFRYYGEMITYLGMTGPMALFALISWLRNPYDGTGKYFPQIQLEVAEQTFGKIDCVEDFCKKSSILNR